MDVVATDYQFDDEAQRRLREAGLYDLLVPTAGGPEGHEARPLTPDEVRQQRAFARIFTLARDFGRGLHDEDYLRRECLALLIELRTSALLEGIEIGLSLCAEPPDRPA